MKVEVKSILCIVCGSFLPLPETSPVPCPTCGHTVDVISRLRESIEQMTAAQEASRQTWELISGLKSSRER